MGYKIDEELKEKAKKMLRHGDSFNKIMDKTHLRLKDLKRIQRTEINPYYK